MTIRLLSAIEEIEVPETQGWIIARSNPSLRKLRVTAVTQSLDISSNPLLETIEAPDLVSGVDLTFLDNATLRDLDAPSMVTAPNLRISGSPLLRTIDFGSLREMRGSLSLTGTALPHLNAFAGLRSRLGALTLSGNSALSDVTGLASLDDANGSDPIVTGAVVITDNPALPSATVQALLDALEAKFSGLAFPGGVTVSGNGGG